MFKTLRRKPRRFAIYARSIHHSLLAQRIKNDAARVQLPDPQKGRFLTASPVFGLSRERQKRMQIQAGLALPGIAFFGLFSPLGWNVGQGGRPGF
jgi:hypothetical protein